MSMEDFGDKRLEDQNKEKDLNRLESGQNLNRPDKKLLLGTVQFYEDILLSLKKSLIAVYNNLGKHIEVWGSSDFKDLYGINPEDFKGKTLKDIYPDPVVKELKNSIDEVFKTAKHKNTKILLNFPKGDFWFEANLSPLLNDEDEVTAVVAYFHDISESVGLAKDAGFYEEKLRNLEGVVNEGIISTNLKGVITSVNKNLLEISGLEEKDFLGKKITKLPLLEPMFVPRFESIIESIAAGRQLPAFEFKWIDKNNSVHWFEVETSTRIKNDKKSGIHVIFSDITEQKIIVQDLLKSKQAYKVIIENAHEAIFILQEDKVRFCNSRLLEMVNYSMDELIKTPIQEYIHPRDQKSASEKINEAFKEKSSKPISFRIIDSNGNIRWIEIKSILIDWDNQPGLLAFATDITDRKRESEKEKKELESLKFLSEKALEFVELKSDYNIYQFIVEKIKEVIGDSIILVFSYDPYTNITKTEFIECPEESRENLLSIINNSPDRLNHKLNHELIKNLSFGKVIKYNDGLFEKGYNIFQKKHL